MAVGAGESESCRCCWARASRGSRALLGSILKEGRVQVSASSPMKGWPPQKYLNVTGSAWKRRTRSSYDSTRHIDPGKGKDSTLNHRWRPRSVERVLTIGYDAHVGKVVVSGQGVKVARSQRRSTPYPSHNSTTPAFEPHRPTHGCAVKGQRTPTSEHIFFCFPNLPGAQTQRLGSYWSYRAVIGPATLAPNHDLLPSVSDQLTWATSLHPGGHQSLEVKPQITTRLRT